jgi:hypothetical protein
VQKYQIQRQCELDATFLRILRWPDGAIVDKNVWAWFGKFLSVWDDKVLQKYLSDTLLTDALKKNQSRQLSLLIDFNRELKRCSSASPSLVKDIEERYHKGVNGLREEEATIRKHLPQINRLIKWLLVHFKKVKTDYRRNSAQYLSVGPKSEVSEVYLGRIVENFYGDSRAVESLYLGDELASFVLSQMDAVAWEIPPSATLLNEYFGPIATIDRYEKRRVTGQMHTFKELLEWDFAKLKVKSIGKKKGNEFDIYRVLFKQFTSDIQAMIRSWILAISLEA